MNKITTIGMPMHRLYVIVMFLCVSSFCSAQITYTTLKKNVNPLAFNLDHNLSSSQDSLLLENKFLFKKVRISNKKTEKVYDFKPAVKSAKIPLADLPLGKYTVMFYQADKIIVFQINRVSPFEDTDTSDSDVAMNEVDDDIDLDFDTANISLATNGTNLDIENEIETFKETYNISNLDRDHVQTRADYRRNNLRPNGKPYND